MPERATLPASSSLGIKPDVDGFVLAQERLRRDLGTDVVFLVPVAPTWPAGTPLDPETGRPYDPTVEPESGGTLTPVPKRVGLVYRPIRVNVEDPMGDDVRSGIRSGESVALSISEDDILDVRDATQVTIGDKDWKITSFGDDPGPDTRYIAFAEAR